MPEGAPSRFHGYNLRFGLLKKAPRLVTFRWLKLSDNVGC